MGENKINIDHNVISSQKSELTITVGKHTATVSERRQGKCSDISNKLPAKKGIDPMQET